jgi:WD40 repeat protein
VGRLLPHRDVPAIARWVDEIAAAAQTPWLRPLFPALHPPGTELERTLEGHSASVFGVAVTPDGQRAVSASGDQALKVWDLETGLPLVRFHCDAGLRCCTFAGKQKIIAGDQGGRLHFLLLEEQTRLKTHGAML